MSCCGESAALAQGFDNSPVIAGPDVCAKVLKGSVNGITPTTFSAPDGVPRYGIVMINAAAAATFKAQGIVSDC